MITLSDIARISGLAEEQVLTVAEQVSAQWQDPAAANILNGVKTLDFTEATAMLSVLLATGANPLCLLELGTQHGASTWIICQGLQRLGIQPRIVTYDVERHSLMFSDPAIEFRLEDIADKCESVLDELAPHAVFLDAHPWSLTYNMTVAARRRKAIVFMHDVSDELWKDNLQSGRLPLEGNECNPNIQWERKVLETVFGSDIHSGHHETDDYRIDLVRSHFGLAICRPRKQ